MKMHMTNRMFHGDFYPEDHIDNPEYIDSKGRILLEEIYGDVFLEDYIGDAISLRVINGTAYFRNWQGNAPKLERISKCAYFMGWDGDAPSLIRIGGSAYFEGYNGRVDALEVVDDAYFKNWINDAPRLKTIKGNAYFTGWKGQSPMLETARNIQLDYNNLLSNKELQASQINFYQKNENAVGRYEWLDARLQRIIGSCFVESSFLEFTTENIARALIPFYLLLDENDRIEMEADFKLQKNPIQKLIGELKHEYTSTPIDKILRLKCLSLKVFCFQHLRPSEMMNILGSERISVAGIEMNYFQYNFDGVKRPISKHNIYETYHSTRHIEHNLPEIFAVKCWCTTTENEHWIFIEEKYKDNPLEAIASTFHISDKDISQIKCLKRQGDILIAEMKESELELSRRIKKLVKTGNSSYKLIERSVQDNSTTIYNPLKDKSYLKLLTNSSKNTTFNDFIRPLSAEEYFSLLEVET